MTLCLATTPINSEDENDDHVCNLLSGHDGTHICHCRYEWDD